MWRCPDDARRSTGRDRIPLTPAGTGEGPHRPRYPCRTIARCARLPAGTGKDAWLDPGGLGLRVRRPRHDLRRRGQPSRRRRSQTKEVQRRGA
ncbi:hypothetical protein SGPA1_12119 [Streptomyces misionensis JCM 4497]